MRLYVDREANALYLRLDDADIVESNEVHPGIVLDFDADNEVVGIEVLNVRDRLTEANLRRLEFEVE